MVERAAISILNETRKPHEKITQMGVHWYKRWISRQSGLYKVKRKPLAFSRKNASNKEVLKRHFDLFKEQQDKYRIQPEDV